MSIFNSHNCSVRKHIIPKTEKLILRKVEKKAPRVTPLAGDRAELKLQAFCLYSTHASLVPHTPQTLTSLGRKRFVKIQNPLICVAPFLDEYATKLPCVKVKKAREISRCSKNANSKQRAVRDATPTASQPRLASQLRSPPADAHHPPYSGNGFPSPLPLFLLSPSSKRTQVFKKHNHILYVA